MNTTTQTSTGARRSRLIALVVGICALAIPSIASANYGSVGDDGSEDGVPRDAGLVIPDHTSLNASLNSPTTVPSDQGPTNVASNPSGEYSSINAISGAPAEEPTFASSAPSAGDPFDWGDAALGAGVVMALMTLGGVALITLRRRTAVSPSA
jgi:hypothetical protein